jgi:hypothetical protein
MPSDGGREIFFEKWLYKKLWAVNEIGEFSRRDFDVI